MPPAVTNLLTNFLNFPINYSTSNESVSQAAWHWNMQVGSKFCPYVMCALFYPLILIFFQVVRTFMPKNYSYKCFLCLPQATISVHGQLQGFPPYISRLPNLSGFTGECFVISFLPHTVISSPDF